MSLSKEEQDKLICKANAIQQSFNLAFQIVLKNVEKNGFGGAKAIPNMLKDFEKLSKGFQNIIEPIQEEVNSKMRDSGSPGPEWGK